MRYVFSILGLVVVLAVLAGLKGAQIGSLISAGETMKKAGPPPEAVGTAIAQEQTWEGTLSAVGTVVSTKGVSLSNEVPGKVTRIHFESGQVVRQGEVLVELESTVERAQLASIKARRKYADVSLKRSQKLAEEGVLARAQLDADEASYASLVADERALEAQIAKKVVRAPFSGRIGIREVNLGQYLSPGTTISELETTETLFVDFTAPQQYATTLRVGMPVRTTLEGDTTLVADGKIDAVESALDATTRNVKVRASVPNDKGNLRPGMFVTANVVLPERPRVIIVPVTAVVHASYGDSVFVVENKPGPDGKPRKVARQQFVRLGEGRGDFVALQQGIKPGQEVVTAGAFKLRNGAAVTVDNRVKPKAELAPRPENR